MDARKRVYAGTPEPAARDSGSPQRGPRDASVAGCPSRARADVARTVRTGKTLIAGYFFRQSIENVRQIGLDRARVDVEHAIAALDQPCPPLGTRLGGGRAFLRGHEIDHQPQRE